MHYNHQNSKTVFYLIISLFILALVILWGQGVIG